MRNIAITFAFIAMFSLLWASAVQAAPATQTVAQESVRGIVFETLAKCVKGFDPAKVAEMKLPEDIALPAGRLTHTVQDGRVEPDGKFSMRVAFLVGGEEKRSVWVWGRVRRTVKVLITSRPLRKFDPVTDDDVQVVEVEAKADTEGALTEPAQAVGLVASRPLSSGIPLKEEYLRQPKVINRGEPVKIIARGPGLIVTATGKAKEDGLLGGRIRVENLKSGKTVVAEVISEGVVGVAF
jgi:flagellar basal body P-ring formation protein FlgA